MEQVIKKQKTDSDGSYIDITGEEEDHIHIKQGPSVIINTFDIPQPQQQQPEQQQLLSNNSIEKKKVTTKKRPVRDTKPKRILFYSTRDQYGCFSNFSAHPINLKGYRWATTEHYFQAQKFAGTSWEEHIRDKVRGPTQAAAFGRRRDIPLRSDWEYVKDEIMKEALVAKFTQNRECKRILLGTGDAELVEHTTKDKYWADGGDGSGKNMLGKLLMEVRRELREADGKQELNHDDEENKQI